MDLDTRRLRAFLTVAEELHFSRAAEVLHLSQPALSQQIRALEQELQVTLFARTSRSVELTPAGEALYGATPRALYELDRALEAAKRASVGTTGRLIIGSVRTGLAGIVPRVMREFATSRPGFRLEIVHMDTGQQLRALADRRIDVGVVRAATPTEAVVVEPLVAEPLMLALPADHRLAAVEAVPPAVLADEPFVSWPRHLGADFFDIVVAFCRRNGFNPRVIAEGGDIDTQLALVAAGFGVSLQPSFYAGALPDGVVFRPLEGTAPKVALQLAWRRDHAAAVADFAAAARRAVGQ